MKRLGLSILSALTGVAIGAGTVAKVLSNKVQISHSYAEKHLALFLMMNQWVRVKQEGKNIASYLSRYGYQKIAIYGMSYAGETLINELKDSGISVAYGIDKNADTLYADVQMVSMEDNLAEVDAIVVTPITFFDEIEEKLSEKVDCPIISLEDILYDV